MALPNKKPLVAHSEFYQTRKKELVKIFKGFKKEKLILDFQNSPSVTGADIVCFSLHLYSHTEQVRINISKSSHSSWLRDSLRLFTKLEVSIGDDKNARNLQSHLRDYILKLNFGIFTEIKFNKQAGGLNDFGIRVEKSTHEEDRKGVDFWIYFQDSVVPLQIKTSIFGQEEHQRKFPKIPSILYLNKKYSDTDLYRTLFEICLAYKNNEILHIQNLVKKDKFAKSLE